jgi:hypothetical protein
MSADVVAGQVKAAARTGAMNAPSIPTRATRDASKTCLIAIRLDPAFQRLAA